MNTMTPDRQLELKRAVARAALDEVRPVFGRGVVIGVGTGATADCFIDVLAEYRDEFHAAVASSDRTAQRLASHGIEVLDLNAVSRLQVYVDGADEITPQLHMIKGGGGALPREKIVAAVAERFVCIVDSSKKVDRLGRFPLPVEVIPMARGHVARQLMKLSGQYPAVEVELRESQDGAPYRTDNGNWIIDVHGLSIVDAVGLETALDAITGLVTNGLFARRGADLCLLAGESGIVRLEPAASVLS
ncbi:ribose-5-phosphate isomerase RpiA [soil metagenome]